MASLINSPELVQKIMLNGLRDHIRESLRERFQEEMKPIVEEAIKNAMETFEVAVQSFREPMGYRDTIQVLLTDRRIKQ